MFTIVTRAILHSHTHEGNLCSTHLLQSTPIKTFPLNFQKHLKCNIGLGKQLPFFQYQKSLQGDHWTSAWML